MDIIKNAPSCVSLLLIALILFGSIRIRNLLMSALFRTREGRHV